MRSHYQASVWNQAHSPYPDLPQVTEMGWMHMDGRLVPRLLSLPPIPKAYREIPSCGCMKGCLSQRSNCRKIRMECIEAFNCRKPGDNCRNTHDDQEKVHVSTSTCLYDKLMHSYVSCQHLNHAVCLWALQNVFLMWMDSDGTSYS